MWANRLWPILVVALVHCSTFKEGEAPAAPDGGSAGPGPGHVDPSRTPPPDAGGVEGSTTATADAGPDVPDAPVEAGPRPPPDSACNEPWSKAGRTDPACTPRRIFRIRQSTFDASTLAIARTGAGRVGIAFNTRQNADEGTLEVVHFTPDTPTFVPPVTTVIRGSGAFQDVGVSAALGAGTADDLQVVYQALPDGELRYARVGPRPQATVSEALQSGLGVTTALAVAVSPNGDLRLVWFDPGQGRIGTRFRSEASGFFGDRTDVTGSISSSGPAGTGDCAVALDPSGRAHVAWHHAHAAGLSVPRYAEQTGVNFTPSKTLDNNAPTGAAGYSIGLALAGNTRVAAYFYRGGMATTAELRLASWVGQNDVPDVSVLDQAIPAAAESDPRYGVAIASDRFGLLHLVVVRPQSGGGGVIEYRRQTVVGGKKTWLSDIVHDAVLSDLSGTARVAVTVDDASRPHIAFVDGTTGDVYYATRFDR